MSVVDWIQQDPVPGSHRVYWQGDTVRFRLRLSAAHEGSAWLRTNLGHAALTRREIRRTVERGETSLARDWFDIPMRAVAPGHFEVTLPLVEVGSFQAKACFLAHDRRDPYWPPGPNVRLNVQPADTCSGNVIYNAFVRQFGGTKAGRVSDAQRERQIAALDAEGYAVIPPSGTFRDLARELDFIIDTLGCRLLLLLPIHPTPTTYGRMGRFGSPYAALSFTSVDPALAEFDPAATPLEQFAELLDAVHARDARLLIDIAINHTGWAASLHAAHPEWLVRDPQGRIEVPGAWGVRWEDLTRLDWEQPSLWQYIAEVFLAWCRRGVDGFRCDAGYMIPLPAWRYMIAAVRDQYPDTLFLLEGLGGKISVTRQLLGEAGFNWAYSELFQNYDRGQIEYYLPQTFEFSASGGLTVNFAETHDNNRLAATSTTWARMRTALCALLAPAGAFGFANGVEWLATDKIDVHDAAPLNWGAAENQVAAIARLSAIVCRLPAFHGGARQRIISRGPGNFVAVLRETPAGDQRVIVVANLDACQPTPAAWERAIPSAAPVDLLSEATLALQEHGDTQTLLLEAGQVLALCADPGQLERLNQVRADPALRLEHRQRQRWRAQALRLLCRRRGCKDVSELDLDAAVAELTSDPQGFCRTRLSDGEQPITVDWQWPRDLQREVMVPPGHLLLAQAPHPFRARLACGDEILIQERSLPRSGGGHFALLAPPADGALPRRLILHMSLYAPQRTQHAQAPIMLLAAASNAAVIAMRYGRAELLQHPPLALATNGRGAMLRAHAAWGRLESRYDALLAANLNPELPDDRWVMFTRLRGWILYQGNSFELALECLEEFRVPRAGCCLWRFRVPCGQGQHVRLWVRATMLERHNRVRLDFYRVRALRRADHLPDAQMVQLILRPDVEDRSYHELTKAHTGPEHLFPAAIRAEAQGFVFAPDPARRLHIRLARGEFRGEPEWRYMVYRAKDAERGHDPHGDLFSPGYFTSLLPGGQTERLEACVETADEQAAAPELPDKAAFERLGRGLERRELPHVLSEALDQFVVQRGALHSVIAGYPWFLDWGRDSLMVTRGLIASGRLDTARDLLIQFGRFEQHGTLPNMIRGQDAANRDTSDAPLWFCTACGELAQQASREIYDLPCGQRPLREVLLSIGRHCMAGTPNGIRLDPATGLIFSPAHFTWMDTNHPAASPREGYPVEIQALWHRSLSVLATLDPTGPWEALRQQVSASIASLFWLEQAGFLSDCRHGRPDDGALAAEADDALRPNQLLALTLGAFTDRERSRKVLVACSGLLVPGAMRSIADQPVRRPLPIVHHGRNLNDPLHPYWGSYSGDEDTRRKPAYHNGTAWTWLLPPFCEAWAACFGEPGRQSARSWLSSSAALVRAGCAGQLPELCDGNAPHPQRGCDAQAWGVSEWLRVWHQLA